MPDNLLIQSDSPHCQNGSSENRRQTSSVVLIAESDQRKRNDLKTLLDLYELKVLEARDGEEAIDLTVRERPDLILINTGLPQLDGFETTRLIRTIKFFDATPIVFLSGQTGRATRKKAFAVGGNGYHIEPLDLERLDTILENYVFRNE